MGSCGRSSGAPSNLGLRPPQPGSVPGCAKAPEALREAGLHDRLARVGASDVGVVLPGRYVDDAEPTAGRVRNQDAIVDHAQRLAARIAQILERNGRPLVLGGDCSLLVAAGTALRRRGRFGLVHLDGHTDFRHPGNSEACLNLAGEDLAAVVGLHWPAISDIERLGPYFNPLDVVHVGCRDDDAEAEEVAGLIGAVIPAGTVIERGTEAAVRRALAVANSDDTLGYWLHLDVDILDPDHLRAVDSPDPGGVDPEQLTSFCRDLRPAPSVSRSPCSTRTLTRMGAQRSC